MFAFFGPREERASERERERKNEILTVVPDGQARPVGLQRVFRVPEQAAAVGRVLPRRVEVGKVPDPHRQARLDLAQIKNRLFPQPLVVPQHALARAQQGGEGPPGLGPRRLAQGEEGVQAVSAVEAGGEGKGGAGRSAAAAREEAPGGERRHVDDALADRDANPPPPSFFLGPRCRSGDGEDAPGEVVEREVGAGGHGEEGLHLCLKFFSSRLSRLKIRPKAKGGKKAESRIFFSQNAVRSGRSADSQSRR